MPEKRLFWLFLVLSKPENQFNHSLRPYEPSLGYRTPFSG